MRVIVDTNVFAAGIFWQGHCSRILEAWAEEKITLVVATDIYAEYERIVHRLSRKYKAMAALKPLHISSFGCEVYEEKKLPSPVTRDPNDDMFIACAIISETKIIISGDKDLLEVSGVFGIRVMKPAAFVEEFLS